MTVYDFGEEGDQLYLVMELVAGETLAQRLARGEFPGTTRGARDRRADRRRAGCGARAGVIHRDIKPGNLLLATAGGVKVSDFGVAKAVGESTELTRTGMMVGSPAYMAPEQVQGIELDGRSDLFSLGVVLYEMLMHRKPFPADTLTTLVYQILHQDPFESATVAGRLHPDLIDLLRWSLDKERDVRIPDAQTFAARARALIAQFARSGATSPTAPVRGPGAPAPPLAASAAGLGTLTTQGGGYPAPLPPASYATSAPTEIVQRRPGGRRAGGASCRGSGLPSCSPPSSAVSILKSPSPPPNLGSRWRLRSRRPRHRAEVATTGPGPGASGNRGCRPAQRLRPERLRRSLPGSASSRRRRRRCSPSRCR